MAYFHVNGVNKCIQVKIKDKVSKDFKLPPLLLYSRIREKMRIM